MEYNNHQSDNLYISKVIKYKIKYIKLEQQIGGNTLDEDISTYTVIGNVDILNKLLRIQSSTNADMIRSLENDDDNTIRGHASTKIIELEEAEQEEQVAQVEQVAPMAQYNPDRNIIGINPPLAALPTQSIFYMPLITEAYYLARDMPVPQEILNQGGLIINLGNISREDYNRMVTLLSHHLRQNGNIALLNQHYGADAPPSPTRVGHILDVNQESWLDNVTYDDWITLKILLDTAIGAHYGIL